MCGILAALRGAGAPPLDAAVLRRLAALQSHRGPDGSGDTAQHDGAGFAVTDAVLLHERLAIIDVSGGAQPLFSADGQVALVANGEVYDYVRHRRELEAAPSRCVFATHSDCEVLLHLYLTHGPSFLADADVHGMFGFVIVDNRPAGHGVGDGHGGSGSYSHSDVGDGDGDGGAAAAAAATDAGDARAPDRAPRPRIIVARDHVGIVPLHWGRGKDGTVWVASEIKSLIGAAFDSVVGRDGGGGGGGVDAPLSVAHFPPASMYDSATDAVTRWYEPAYIAKTPTAPLDVTALRDALVRAVRSHMMSDVPYGVVLSGGLDSSLIAAVAARVLAEKSAGDGGDGGGVPDHQWVPPARLNTFTIGFEGSSDLKHAQIVADYIGSEHHNFVVTPDEVVGAIDASVRHLETYDAGVTRPGTMQYLLAKKIHALGVKVVLSGEGADEVFAGYWHYKNIGSPEEVHREAVNMLGHLHHNCCMRANKAMSAHAVELRVPLLDKSFLSVAMGMDPVHKMPGVRHGSTDDPARDRIIEKWALRSVGVGFRTDRDRDGGGDGGGEGDGEGDGKLLIPEAVLWREKDGFSSGVGDAYKHALDAFFDSRVSDAELVAAAETWPGRHSPKTKEEVYVRRVFDDVFGAVAGEEFLADANSRRRVGHSAAFGEAGIDGAAGAATASATATTYR